MKFFYLTLIAVLSVFQISYAQWSTSGTGIYNTNTGFVGIGTGTNGLGSPLTVQGTGLLGTTYQTRLTDGVKLLLFGVSSSAGEIQSSGSIPLYLNYVGNNTILNGQGNGFVGIGVTNPQTNLHIVGTGASIDANLTYTGGGLIVQGNTGYRSSTTGAQLEFVIPANADGTNLWGQARIITVAGNAISGDATGEMILGTRRFYSKTGGSAAWYYGNDLTIDGKGFIGINTTNTFGYQLAVNGSAIATSMTVKLYANWPDYVFKKDYSLPSLTDVKVYIDQNHHLPDMPSAEDVERNGLNLGEINKDLVKKVEELTLYLIEKDKKEKEQESINQNQQKQIDLLIKQVAELSKEKTK